MAGKSRLSAGIDISKEAKRKRLEDKTKSKKTYSPTKRERATNTFVSDQEKAEISLARHDEREAYLAQVRRGTSKPRGY